jgi:hypothetical protein
LEEGLKFLSRIYSDSQKLKPLWVEARQLLTLLAVDQWVTLQVLIAELRIARIEAGNGNKEKWYTIEQWEILQKYETELSYNPITAKEEQWNPSSITVNHRDRLEQHFHIETNQEQYTQAVVLDMSWSMKAKDIISLYTTIQWLYNKWTLNNDTTFRVIHDINDLEELKTDNVLKLYPEKLLTFEEMSAYLQTQWFLEYNEETKKYIPNTNSHEIPSKWTWCTPLYSNILDMFLQGDPPKTLTIFTDGWSDMSSTKMWWIVEWENIRIQWQKNRYLKAIKELAAHYGTSLHFVTYNTPQIYKDQTIKLIDYLESWEQIVSVAYTQIDNTDQLIKHTDLIRSEPLFIPVYNPKPKPFTLQTTSTRPPNIEEKANPNSIWETLELEWVTCLRQDNPPWYIIKWLPSYMQKFDIRVTYPHTLQTSYHRWTLEDSEKPKAAPITLIQFTDFSGSMYNWIDNYLQALDRTYAWTHVQNWEHYIFSAVLPKTWFTSLQMSEEWKPLLWSVSTQEWEVLLNQDAQWEEQEKMIRKWYTPIYTSLLSMLVELWWWQIEKEWFNRMKKDKIVRKKAWRNKYWRQKYRVLKKSTYDGKEEVKKFREYMIWERINGTKLYSWWEIDKTLEKLKSQTIPTKKTIINITTDTFSTNEWGNSSRSKFIELIWDTENSWKLIKLCNCLNIQINLTYIVRRYIDSEKEFYGQLKRGRHSSVIKKLCDYTWGKVVLFNTLTENEETSIEAFEDVIIQWVSPYIPWNSSQEVWKPQWVQITHTNKKYYIPQQ